MKYSVDNLPAGLKDKGLPPEALAIGVDVFNAAMSAGNDDEVALRAAMSAVEAMFSSQADGWKLKKVDAAEQPQTMQVRAARQADESGLVWEVIIIAPGLGLGSPRYYWSDAVLEAAAEQKVYDGVDINAYELTADFFGHLSIPNVDMLEDIKRYLSSKKVGWIERTWFESGIGIKAIVHFLPEHAWLPKALQHGIDQGNSQVLGLSIDSRVKGFEIMAGDIRVIWVTQIKSASSVDVVTRPAAGGKFLRAVAGLQTQEAQVDKEKLLQLIQKARPDLLKGKDLAAISEDEILGIAQQALSEPPKKESKPDGEGDLRAAQAAIVDLGKGLKEEIKNVELRAACGRMLDTAMATCDLPDKAKERVRTGFEGQIFEQAKLDEAIKSEKDYLAAMSAPAMGVGDQTRRVQGLDSMGKIQAAVDRMFGLNKGDIEGMAQMSRLDGRQLFGDLRAAQAADFDSAPRIGGLGELYALLTGDTEVRGVFDRKNLPADLRACQEISSGTFSYALNNTMYRRLVKDYRALDFMEDLLISTRKPVSNFKTQEAVKIGYFGDLDTVDPESGDYQEIAAITDEEATYSLLQKGNILTITRKTILNDDLTLIVRLLSRLTRAARRTHAKYVWNFFINNSNCSDGTAWFTGGHGNLGATALSFSTVLTAYLAIAAFTEKDSGEKIGLLDSGVKPVLIYPDALMSTGEQIVSDDYYYASNDLTTKTRNPVKGKIDGKRVGLLTDANDWGLLLPPSEVDMVEMGYLNGNQDPEMFVADTPQSEQVFVADKIRHKIRHEYAGTVVDYVSGYKAVVA